MNKRLKWLLIVMTLALAAEARAVSAATKPAPAKTAPAKQAPPAGKPTEDKPGAGDKGQDAAHGGSQPISDAKRVQGPAKSDAKKDPNAARNSQ